MLKSFAQEILVVEDPSLVKPGAPIDISSECIECVEDLKEGSKEDSKEESECLEVSEEGPIEIEIRIDGLAGAPPGTPDPEPMIEVVEQPDKPKEDDNDARKSKKSESWDWESKGANGFFEWLQVRVTKVPKHSGYDTAGLERAISYLERLDKEISKAMRQDLEGELDAEKISKVREEIEKGIDALNDRIEKVTSSKKKTKKKADGVYTIVKEAQKITGVKGIYVTVPLLISRVARLCINGMVSAGHDIEDTYKQMVKKYKLTDREQAETMQLLSDMGYALRMDRGYMPDEDVDINSSDNYDWAGNFRG